MRLIDRIALNRAVKLLADFIIRLVEIFQKQNTGKKIIPTPSPHKPRPLKNILDSIVPWRKK